jgi:L-ascorbate metabolism protein UlaG (beta-lactamase superfamily)
MKISWFGTATISISHDESSILFDPFIPMNGLLPLPSISELASLGDIFVTHGHFDHLMYVAQVIRSGSARVYCSESAADKLLQEGLPQNRITTLMPGDSIKNGPFTIRVFRGAHIRFDPALIIKTLFSRRTCAHFKQFWALVRLAKRYPQGEVLVYEIEAGGKKVLHMGSLNLDPTETYPTGSDLLTLPFQGRSDLNTYALKFIDKLKPKALFLHHFDDSFPPVSSTINTSSFIRSAASAYPDLPVIVPEYKEVIVI